MAADWPSSRLPGNPADSDDGTAPAIGASLREDGDADSSAPAAARRHGRLRGRVDKEEVWFMADGSSEGLRKPMLHPITKTIPMPAATPSPLT